MPISRLQDKNKHIIQKLQGDDQVEVCYHRGEMWSLNEPAHEIMVLFVLRKLILQTSICSHPVGQDVRCLVGPFVYFHTLCVRTAKALARLRGCADSPESSPVAYVISTIISWAGSISLLFASWAIGATTHGDISVALEENALKCHMISKVLMKRSERFST